MVTCELEIILVSRPYQTSSRLVVWSRYVSLCIVINDKLNYFSQTSVLYVIKHRKSIGSVPFQQSHQYTQDLRYDMDGASPILDKSISTSVNWHICISRSAHRRWVKIRLLWHTFFLKSHCNSHWRPLLRGWRPSYRKSWIHHRFVSWYQHPIFCDYQTITIL